MPSILPNAKNSFFDNNGSPLTAGTIDFYIPNTTVRKNTYQDQEQTILNTNPIILDSRGEALIWGTGSYRQVLKDQFGNLIWDRITQDPNAAISGNITDDLFVAGTDFTPGITTALTLSTGPGSIDNTWIYFDGVYQDDNTVASLNGALLTFTNPIPVGVTLVTVKIGSTVSIGVPATGSVTDISVATNANINSNKLSYLFNGAGAVRRTGYSKWSDILSVKDFGAVGDGVTDDTEAFNKAIDYANSLNPIPVDARNVVGITIFIPNGRYIISSSVNPILKGSIAIKGESVNGVKLLLSANTATFTWNNTGSSDLVVNGEFTDCTIEYLSNPPSGALIWYLENSYRIYFRNINLINVGKVCQMGSPTRPVGVIEFNNVDGFVYNGGQSSFIPVSGAGLYLYNCRMFVGAVPNPPVDRSSTMITVPNTNLINVDTATWDTIQISDCFFERFYDAIHLYSTAGIIINNIYCSNTFFDYIANRVIYAVTADPTQGGILSLKFTQCWFACWDDAAVFLQGPGVVRTIEFVSCNVISAGAYGYFINGATEVIIDTCKVAGTNRLSTPGVYPGIAISVGSKITINNVNSGFDATADGFPWQATYGLIISPNIDYYTVTNCEFAGSVAPINIGTNFTGSQNRKIINNRNTQFDAIFTVITPSTGVPFVNTFPYQIRYNVFGGTVSSILLNGIGINGATSGQFILNPGDSITVSYSGGTQFSYSGIN